MVQLKIGSEIEWSCKIKQNPVDGGFIQYWNLQYDGSVQGQYEAHEFATKIGKLPVIDTEHPTDGINQACEQFRILLRNMDKIDVNHSQGLHFHVSGFQKKSVIFSKEFFDYFMGEYTKMAKKPQEKERVSASGTLASGRRNYAVATYDSRDRFHAINYVFAYSEWKTFEFRIFPSTKSVADYRKYLKLIVRCITRFEKKKVKVETFEAKDDEGSNNIKLEEVVF